MPVRKTAADETQPEATKAVHCPVEGVHVIGKKGTGDTENQLTQISLTEYIAQTFLP
jgi:hypothetical protein